MVSVVKRTLYRRVATNQALERIKRLERLLGQKTEEVAILKEVIKRGCEKKLTWQKPLVGSGDSQWVDFVKLLKSQALIFMST